MRTIFFLNVLSCCVFTTLGLYAVLRRRPSTRLGRSSLNAVFVVLNWVLAAGTFGTAFFITASDAREAAAWFYYFAFTWFASPGLFLLFCLLLTGRRFKALMLVLFVPGLVVLIAHLVIPKAVMAEVISVPLGYHVRYNHASFWHWLNVANYSCCGLASIAVLLKYGLASGDDLFRRRALMVLWSIVPTFFGTFATGFLIRFFGNELLPPMLPIFLSVLVVGLAIALFRYDLLAMTSGAVAERILDGVYDAVVLADADGKVLDTNVRYVSPESDLPPLSRFIPEAEDAAAWLAAKARVSNFECRFAFEANRTAPAGMHVRSIGSGAGSYEVYVVTAHNLSAEKDLALEVDRRMAMSAALRSVEANFSRAFQASPAGMLILELESRSFLDANEAMSRLFRVPIQEIVGARAFELGLSVAQDELAPFLDALDRGETCPSRELSVYRRDGSRALCLASVSPLQFRGKRAALFTMVDISELERLRNDFARAQKLESIGILAGGIAHDFNNIMTAILGNISLARMGLREEDEQALPLARAETACMRARDLSRQLLTFSKGGEPKTEPTDVVQLVREAVRMATAGSKVASSFSVESGVVPAYVDSGQMIQCFNNIAINAVQAMEEGGTLSVSVRRAAVAGWSGSAESGVPAELAPGDYVAVDFQDTGPGISEDLVERIFDPYVTTKAKGSGLGLTICYSILKRHRGGISVQSRPGGGTKFSVYVRAAEALPPEESERPVQFGKGAVLFMDDEYAVRAVVAQMLQRLGYEPTVCADGEAAVEAFKQARAQGRAFSAVILDLTVPAGMGGVAAAAAIRSMDGDVPLYVSSGYSDAPVLSDYGAFGFDGIIEKPFGIELLSRRLSGH